MKNIILILLKVVFTFSISKGNSGGPPTNYSNNAPNFNNCTSCHSGNINSGNGSISFTNLPEYYIPGQSYSVGVIVTGSNSRGYGFQASAQVGDQSIGSFGLNSSSSNLEMNGNYVQHNSRTENGIWNFVWNAPHDDAGNVTFSASGLATGGSTGTGGDQVYTEQVEVQSQVVSVSNRVEDIYFKLNGNYPNPFNMQTLISFEIPTDSKVRINIFDISGKVVRTLVDNYKTKGNQTTTWDARDNLGHEVPSGIYYYTIEAGANNQARTMTLIK
mgnify:FL=1